MEHNQEDSRSGSNKLLLSQDKRLAVLQDIFYDAILLDYGFTIQSIGRSVFTSLGYNEDWIKGKSIDLIIPEFSKQATDLLGDGYFVRKEFKLRSKWKESILVNLSGFYTGLLTDINGFIILRYQYLEGSQVANQQLDLKTDEMDHFVYQASHSLRGPLATIKGLINIAKVERDSERLDFVHKQMEEFANRLDTKLYKLMCFAEVDRINGIPKGKINARSLQSKLDSLTAITDQTVLIDCKVTQMDGLLVNEHLIESLIINLVSFILTADKQAINSILITISGFEKMIEVEFVTTGFKFDTSLQTTLVGEHGFGHLLEQPDLNSIYSAKKVISKLQGKINFSVSSSLQTCINVSLPYNFVSLARVAN